MTDTDEWFLQCPAPDPEWELNEEETAVYYKIQRKIDEWLKKEINDVGTVECGEGFKPEIRYE